MTSGRIRIGIGGWSYEPWRETFYPEHVTKQNELHYASREVTAIEINSTFYRMQKPHVFAKWRDETPDDFVFSIKAPRFIAQRKVMAEAGSFIDRFVESGIAELRGKLGPILWQLDPKQTFSASDLGGFLERLPPEVGGQRLRHALNVRHASFRDPAFAQLAGSRGAAIVYEDDDTHPAIDEVTADFAYARLRRCVATESTGYTSPALDAWVKRAKLWAQGPRDVFVYFINGAKERAPAAARALISRIGSSPQ